MKLTWRDIAISSFSGLGFALILTCNIYPFLGDGQSYSDLIVGHITWTDYDKDKEWLSFYILLLASVVVSLLFTLFFNCLRSKSASLNYVNLAHRLLSVAWLPALFGLGAAIMTSGLYLTFFNLSIFLVVSVVVTLLFLTAKKEWNANEDIEVIFDLVLSALLFLILIPLSVVSVFVFFGKIWPTLNIDSSLISNVTVFSLVTAFLFNIGVFLFSPSLKRTRTLLSLALLSLQATFPLLLFRFFSQGYLAKDTILILHKSTALTTLIIFLILFAWYSLVCKLRLFKRDAASMDLKNVLSMAALYPIAVYVSCSSLAQEGIFFIALDPFHAGEHLLPWHQLVELKKIPYVDFVPIHGLMGLLYGGINSFFYGHTAETFPIAMLLLRAIAIALTFCAIFSFAGPLFALCLTPLAIAPYPVFADRIYFLVPALLYVCNTKHVEKTYRWLYVWVFLMVFMPLYNVPVGAGFVIGSFPLAIFVGFKAFRDDRKKFNKIMLFLGSLILLLFLMEPTRKIVSGYLGFVTENAEVNTMANSIGLFQYEDTLNNFGLSLNGFQWIFFKISWLFLSFLSITLFFCMLTVPKGKKSPIFLLLAVLPLTLLIIGKWALGRVENDDLSRTGVLSYTVLVVFVPLILIGARSFIPKSILLLVLAVFVGGVSSIGETSFKTLYYRWVGEEVPKDTFLVDPLREIWRNPLRHHIADDYIYLQDSAHGLPRLGGKFINAKKFDQVLDLKKAIKPFLKEGETFFDLTSNSDLYFYLDKSVPVKYSADYAAGNPKSHLNMLEGLRKNPPPLVLIAPRYAADGGPASLRSYRFYREFIDAYVPFEDRGFSFLVRRDRAPAVSHEDGLKILEKAFNYNSLGSVPAAWGRSWGSLKKYFSISYDINLENPKTVNFTKTNGNKYTPAGSRPKLIFDLRPSAIVGRRVDHILISLACSSSGNKAGNFPEFQLKWTTSDDPQGRKTSLSFTGGESRLLVPIGSQPRWRLASQIDLLQLELVNPEACNNLTIKEILFLELI